MEAEMRGVELNQEKNDRSEIFLRAAEILL